MLRFKQFISCYLTEAKAEHFAHIGLDINDPHHRDMLDMFNKYTHMMPKKNPNQYKSLEELHDAVKPHLDELTRQREEEHQQQQALQRGDAELVHHDPSTGLKVFKVKSGKGCRAVGSDTKWCTADPGSGDVAFQGYDPEREHSYVIHTPEKGNLSKIGIIGVKPGEKHNSGLGGNFQDKGNVSVTDEDWEMLRKKYNLDSVKALHGIRGLINPKILKHHQNIVNNLNSTSEELHEVYLKSHDPEIHRAIANHKNTGENTLTNIAVTSNDPDIHRAIANHKNAGTIALANIAFKSNDPEIHRAIVNHENADDDALTYSAQKSDDPEIHRAIANHKNAGKFSLIAVSKKSDDPEIHRAIVNHKNAFDDALAEIALKSNDPEIHRAIANHKNAKRRAISYVAQKYKAVNHAGSIIKAIDDHIKKQQNNPYQLESTENIYIQNNQEYINRRVKCVQLMI